MPTEDLPLQFARTRRFSLGVPRRFTVSPDGRRVLFVRTAGGRSAVSGLWMSEDGVERLLADPLALGGTEAEGDVPEAERVRRERARGTGGGITAYAADAACRLVAFTLGGDLWTVRTDGGGPRRVPTAGPAVAPQPGPDGSRIAYVTGGALHVVDADGGRDLVLAPPEGPEAAYGLPDHVSAESIGRTRSFWWSPDGDALLAVRVDTSGVQRWWTADPADPARPPRAVAYPAAGTANARLSLHVLRLDGGRADVRLPERAGSSHPAGAWTDPAFEYVVAAGWDGPGPYAVVQTRDQRSALLLGIDAATGATEPLSEFRDGHWLEFVPGTPLRTPAAGWVVTTQEGTRGLLMTGTGVRTPEGLYVEEVYGVADGRLYFAAGEDPTETHVWAYSPAAGFERLTDGPGLHSAAVGGGTVVLDSRTMAGQTVTVLRDGAPAGSIRVLAERPVVEPRPRFLTFGDRQLRAALYLPSSYEPGPGRLPLVVHSYSGPGLRTVVRAAAWHHAVNQWYAEQGFAVLSVDGRGTPGRDRDWETAIHGDQLGPVVEDQADAVRAAAALFPELDTGRVAIRGWSFGGYLAAGAVLHRPDVFHAAVAGAAPTDLRLYDTHWKERYLGHPDVQPENYERCSLVAHAHRLTRPLMLVHGLADDNVVPAHALRLSAALLAAGRPHRVLPLPGATHLVTAEGVADTLLRCDLAFVQESLGNGSSEEEYAEEEQSESASSESEEGSSRKEPRVKKPPRR